MFGVLIAMAIFAVIHTLTAGRTKSAFRRKFGDRAYFGLYRIVYNGLAFLTFLPVILFVALDPGPVLWEAPSALTPVLAGVQLIGMAGLAVSLLQIDYWRFAGLRQLYAYISGGPLPLPDEPLQMRGLYGLVRHPLYLFSLMLIWPVPTMRTAYFAFCVAATLYFIIGSRMEEERLVDAFGDTYMHYQQRVPWLFPLPLKRKQG